MDRLRHLAPKMRALLLAAMALCIGVRVLTPAGFMPSFGQSTLAIVPCPDSDGASLTRFAHRLPAMAMSTVALLHVDHRTRDDSEMPFHHQSCPYAAAASLAGVIGGFAVILAILAINRPPPSSRALPVLRRQSTRDRPPLRGPPLSV